ncbi:dTDP-4-dehydrorhamnose 3,5-epimerase [soil metagenome]
MSRLPEVVVRELRAFGDDRGRFFETYQEERYGVAIKQSNVSVSAKGVLRGLHSQMPTPQGKLVTVLTGRVWDVVVDARPGSPRFGQWEGFELSEENGRQVWVPPGFLHGFLSQEDGTILSYHVTAPYDPIGDLSVAWNDPALGIEWPLSGPPLLSPKDAAALPLAEIDPARLVAYEP